MAKDMEYLIWTSEADYEDWRGELEEMMPDATEEQPKEAMWQDHCEELWLIREELAHQYREPILVIGDLGLWNGRRSAYKEIESGRLQDCLLHSNDTLDIKWYVDGLGDLRCEDRHHDGTNYYQYRVWKSKATEEDRNWLTDKIYRGDFTQKDLDRFTKRLGDEIGKVYGWTFPKQKKAREYDR